MAFGHQLIHLDISGDLYYPECVHPVLIFQMDEGMRIADSSEWKIGSIIFSTELSPYIETTLAPYLGEIITIGETDYLPVTLTITRWHVVSYFKTRNIEIEWHLSTTTTRTR